MTLSDQRRHPGVSYSATRNLHIPTEGIPLSALPGGSTIFTPCLVSPEVEQWFFANICFTQITGNLFIVKPDGLLHSFGLRPGLAPYTLPSVSIYKLSITAHLYI